MPSVVNFSKPLFAPNGSAMNYFYNVNQPVGPHQPNQIDDVRLVQTLAQQCFDDPTKRRDLPAPSITGIFDIVTAYWILRDQLT